MGYEIWVKQVIRTTTPRITLNSRGRLVFNVAATKTLHESGVDTVFLLWDPDSRRFAVRSTNSKRDARAVNVRYTGKDSKWASIAAKGFLEHIGHDIATTKSYPATWNKDESMFEVSMDEADTEKAAEPVEETTIGQRRASGLRPAGVIRRAVR